MKKFIGFGISETKGSGEFVKLTDGSEVELTEAKTDEELLKEVQDRIAALKVRQAQQADIQTNFVMSTKDSLQLSTAQKLVDYGDEINELKAHEIRLNQAILDKKKEQADMDDKGVKGATADQISALTEIKLRFKTCRRKDSRNN